MIDKFADVELTHYGYVEVSEKSRRYSFKQGERIIPTSQIRRERALKGQYGEVQKVTIPRWLADNEGLA